MTINPDKLRSVAEAGHPSVIMPPEAHMIADALEIADGISRSDIECNTGSPDWNAGRRWYDLDTVTGADKEMIGRAARYLDARGLIEHHPEHPAWVRLKEGVE